MKHIEKLGISPRPWSVKRGCSTWVEDSRGDCICDELEWRGEQAMPNARLIAAAPDLYEYLVRTVGQLEYTLDWCTGISEAADNNARRVAENARAVIAAASGEETHD